MIKRICHIHPNLINKRDKKTGQYVIKKQPKPYFMQQIWRKIIENRLCPWITDAYDKHIDRGYHEYKYRKQLLRLGMFYIYKSGLKQSYDKACVKKINNINVISESDIKHEYAATGIFS